MLTRCRRSQLLHWLFTNPATVGDPELMARLSWLFTGADYPAYPSVTSAMYGSHAQVSRLPVGYRSIWNIGRSAWSDPSRDTVIAPGRRGRNKNRSVASAGFGGGVHFRDAISAGSALGHSIGDRAYDFVTAHVQRRSWTTGMSSTQGAGQPPELRVACQDRRPCRRIPEVCESIALRAGHALPLVK